MGNSQSKLTTKTLIIIAICVIVVGAIVTFVISFNRAVSLPYGLNASMGMAEIKSTMRENGFDFQHSNGNDVYFESKTVYGVFTDFTLVTYDPNDSDYISVSHFYKNLSDEQYTRIKNELSKQFGFPRSRYLGGYVWGEGECSASIDDRTDDIIRVSISYSNGR